MASFHHCIKSGKKGSAQRHARYIERQGTHSARTDLIHTSHGNMPSWAEGNPEYFWRMSDTFERINGAAYREHEIALPNELTVEQLVELVERLIRGLVGNKPYQYAIHAPEGSLGKIQNPHVHIMLSDRLPDGLNRSPERMFARFNPNQPEKGGCHKDSGGKTRMQLREKVRETRKFVADTQNEMLHQHGHEVRVDHRSLREQGIQRTAGRHLGSHFIEGMAEAERAQHVLMRKGEL